MNQLSALFSVLNTKFSGKKTYLTSIVTILGTAATYFSGQSTLFESLQIAIPALLAIFIRHGISSSMENAAAAAVAAAVSSFTTSAVAAPVAAPVAPVAPVAPPATPAA